jgi:CHASE2 domain-containing sensor protein
MTFKDKRQGSAASVFLALYALLAVSLVIAILTRRPRRHFIFPLIFATIRLGANIAAIGWAVNLYSDFSWLLANIILGAEGQYNHMSELTTRLLCSHLVYALLHRRI